VAHPELTPAVVQSDAPIPNPAPPNQSGAAVVHLHSPAVVADHATAGKNTYPSAARHGHADSDAAARHRDGHTGPNTTARYGHTGPDTTARDSYAGFNAAARDSHTTGSTDRDNRAGFGRPVFRGHPQWLRDHDRPGASRAVPIRLT